METLKQFQKTDFYRTIIDNNLFRPLGWTPPRPKEPYRLIGTLLPKDDRIRPTAIIETITGHTTHIVSINDNLDADTKVISIGLTQSAMNCATTNHIAFEKHTSF